MKAESSNEDIESDGDENPLDILGLAGDSEDSENDDDSGPSQEAAGAFWTEDYDEYDFINNVTAVENPPDIASGQPTEKVVHVPPSAEFQPTEKVDHVAPSAELQPTEKVNHGAPSAEFQAILDEFGFDASENEEEEDEVEEDLNPVEDKHVKPEGDTLEGADNGNHSSSSNHDLVALGLDDSDDEEDRSSQIGLGADHTVTPREAIVESSDMLDVDRPPAPLPKIEEVVDEPFADTSFVASDMHENSNDAPLSLLADDCNSPERDWNLSVNESNEAALIRRVSQYLSTHEEEELDRKDSAIEPCQDDDVVEPSSIAMHELEGLSDMEAFTRMAMGRSTLNLKDLRIQSLEPLCLQTLTGLTTLRLPGNEFHDVKALAHSLETLTSLSDLDLSRCQLRELPVLQHVPRLQRFDASQNCLKSSRGILYCTELRQVNLSHNQIRRVEQLETLTLLEDLNMAHNRLGPSVLAAMRTVAACSQLRVLHVVGNPFSSDRAHRVQITDLIPSLELIDDRRVQTLKMRRRAPVTNNEKHRGSLDVSSRGKSISSDQVASILDTSISYGILAQSSPKRPLQSSHQRRPVQEKPLRVRFPSQSCTTQKMQVPAPPEKPTESPASTKQSAIKRTVSPKRLPKCKQKSRKPIAGSPTKSKESSSPKKPWVVAACLASPPPPTRMHEINGRRIRIRSPFANKSEVIDSHASSELLEELKRIDELDAEMESVTGEADAETGSDLNEVQLSLSGLLQEKRRLLQKVSAQLSGGVGTPMENLPLVPPLPSDISISVDRKVSRDISSVDVSDLDGGTEDVRSLLASLRGGIERKRALLEQLQHV